MRPDLVRDLLQLTGEHLVLVLSAMAVAMLIGVPLGILLTRRTGLRRWLLVTRDAASLYRRRGFGDLAVNRTYLHRFDPGAYVAGGCGGLT